MCVWCVLGLRCRVNSVTNTAEYGRVERTDRIVQCRAGYNRIWCDRALCVLNRRGKGRVEYGVI